jgi:uncharacterized membrane protein
MLRCEQIESLSSELQREKTRTREQLDEYEETMRQMRDDKKQREELIADLEVSTCI